MRIIKKVLSEFVVLFLVILTLVPIVWIFLMSLKTNYEIFNHPLNLPNAIRFDNYEDAWELVPFMRLLGNTMYLAFFALIIGTALGIMSSFALARFKHFEKLTKGFYLYFLAGLFVPGFILLFPVFIILSNLGLTNNHWGLILTYVGWSITMNTLLLVAAFRNIPGELEEAAALDGCGVMRICWQIFVPIAKPALATVLLLSFLGIYNEFIFASIMIFSPDKFTIALSASYFTGLFSVDYAGTTAAIMIIVLPQLVLFAFFQRFVIAGIAAGAIKG